MSSFGETWAKRWRLAFNGPRGQKHLGAYASLLVDKARDWGEASIVRAFPSFADSAGLALLASARQIEFDPLASAATKAAVLLIAPTLWRYAGSPTGLLVALHIAGFPGVVLAQQNGLRFQITGTVNYDDLVTRALPSWITRTVLANGNPALPASADGRPAVAANTVPWWTFDAGMDAEGNQYTSRFAVLFTAAGAGSADLTVAANLARLRRVIASWRDGKAKCMGIWVAGHTVLYGMGRKYGDGAKYGGGGTFYAAE